MTSPSICFLREDRLGTMTHRREFPPRMSVGVALDMTPSTASAAAPHAAPSAARRLEQTRTVWE